MTQSNKVILLQFSEDGSEWEIPALFVAEKRAKYFSELDFERGDVSDKEASYQEELEYTMSKDYELFDWLKGSMNWEDIKSVAKMVTPPRNEDYKNWFRTCSVAFPEQNEVKENVEV